MVGIAVAYGITAPQRVSYSRLYDSPDNLRSISGDADFGAAVFAAAGCASCHSAQGTDALAGGISFVSDIGTFYPANISTDIIEGIGGRSEADSDDHSVPCALPCAKRQNQRHKPCHAPNFSIRAARSFAKSSPAW